MGRKRKEKHRETYLNMYSEKEYDEYINLLCELYPNYAKVIEHIEYENMINFTIPEYFKTIYPKLYKAANGLYQFLQLVTGDDKQFLNDIIIVGDAVYNYYSKNETLYGYGYDTYSYSYKDYGSSYIKKNKNKKREKSELAKTKPSISEIL